MSKILEITTDLFQGKESISGERGFENFLWIKPLNNDPSMIWLTAEYPMSPIQKTVLA